MSVLFSPVKEEIKLEDTQIEKSPIKNDLFMEQSFLKQKTQE